VPHKLLIQVRNRSGQIALVVSAWTTRASTERDPAHVVRRIGKKYKGGLGMKKLFMAAAALTIAVAITPSFVSQSEAASAKRSRTAMAATDGGPGSQYCKLASFQRNAPSWNEHYGCLKTQQRQASAQRPAPVRVAEAPAASPEWGPGSQYCKLASFQRNAPSWNEHYGCLRR
jgi:hypothetical protein